MIGFIHVEAPEGGGDSSHVDIQSRNDTCQAGLRKPKVFPEVFPERILAKKKDTHMEQMWFMYCEIKIPSEDRGSQRKFIMNHVKLPRYTYIRFSPGNKRKVGMLMETKVYKSSLGKFFLKLIKVLSPRKHFFSLEGHYCVPHSFYALGHA